MQQGRANFVTGGQYGSEGKGKVVGYLVDKYKIDVSICSFSSQAGHTVSMNGNNHVFRQLPVATIDPDVKLLVSQGAIIDPDAIFEEIDTHNVDGGRLMIHPSAVLITQEHKDREASLREGPKRIASTCKGNGAAMADFVFRDNNVRLARDDRRFRHFLGDTRAKINEYVDNGAMVLVETAQGYGLDIYQGFYPHVTSRGCTPAAEMARIGLAPQKCGDVYGCFRTYPIRVGNIEEDNFLGHSGGCYIDQQEMSWEEITKLSGSPDPIHEYTTVTKRLRRVFTWSDKQFIESIRVQGVTHVCLLFVDYLDYRAYGLSDENDVFEKFKIFEFVKRVKEVMNRHQSTLGLTKICMLSTGPDLDHTVGLR
jgi:adenylosuccinate synthase